MHLETNAGHESIPNRTFSRVENGFHSRTKYLETRQKKRSKGFLAAGVEG